jgi:hypothetical protein
MARFRSGWISLSWNHLRRVRSLASQHESAEGNDDCRDSGHSLACLSQRGDWTVGEPKEEWELRTDPRTLVG